MIKALIGLLTGALTAVILAALRDASKADWDEIAKDLRPVYTRPDPG